MPICRNSIQIDQIQIQVNSWPRNSRFTESVSSPRLGVAVRGIEARKSLIRWQLYYSTPLAFFFFFGRACGASNICTVWNSLPLPITGFLSTAGGRVSYAAGSPIAGGGSKRSAVASTRIGGWFWKKFFVPWFEIGSPTSLGSNDASSWVFSSSSV
jgi:hypothetical protein